MPGDMKTGMTRQNARNDTALLTAFRRERLGYVLLLCACLTLQGLVPALAASLAGRDILPFDLVICRGSDRGEEGGRQTGPACPCLAGACTTPCCGGPTVAHTPGPGAFLSPRPASGVPDASRARAGDERVLPPSIRGPPSLSSASVSL